MHPKPRPKIASLFMTLPILFGGGLMISVLALGVASWLGVLEGACAEDAVPFVQKRIEATGLGDPVVTPQAGRLVITATLPGQDPEVERDSIPRLLGAAGQLTVQDGEQILLSREDVDRAELQLGDSGESMAVVFITEASQERLNVAINADPEGTLQIRLDGALLVERPSVGRVVELELHIIDAGEVTPKQRMRAAIDRVLVLEHGPLPCGLTVAAVTASQ